MNPEPLNQWRPAEFPERICTFVTHIEGVDVWDLRYKSSKVLATASKNAHVHGRTFNGTFKDWASDIGTGYNATTFHHVPAAAVAFMRSYARLHL